MAERFLVIWIEAAVMNLSPLRVWRATPPVETTAAAVVGGDQDEDIQQSRQKNHLGDLLLKAWKNKEPEPGKLRDLAAPGDLRSPFTALLYLSATGCP
jgi:hypothetical protein